MSSALIAVGLAALLTASPALACEKSSHASAAAPAPRVHILGGGSGGTAIPGCDVGPSLTAEEKKIVEWAVDEFVRRLADPSASLDLTDEDIVAGTGVDPSRLDHDRLHAATTAALMARLSATTVRVGSRS